MTFFCGLHHGHYIGHLQGENEVVLEMFMGPTDDSSEEDNIYGYTLQMRFDMDSMQMRLELYRTHYVVSVNLSERWGPGQVQHQEFVLSTVLQYQKQSLKKYVVP